MRRRVDRLRDVRGPAREIQLAWLDDPHRSLSIRWATASRRSPAAVEWRALDEDRWRQVCGHSRRHPAGRGAVHEATLTDLTPGRRYALRVSADAGVDPAWTDDLVIRTPPLDGPIEAVFVCDVGLAGRRDGIANASAAVVAEIASRPPHVVLGGGDYAYADRDARFSDSADATRAWLEQMRPLFTRVAFMPTLGNHEVHLGESAEDWMGHLLRPPSAPGVHSFSIDVGCLHLVALHAPGLAPSAREIEWLRTDLESARARSAAWRIVFQHAPLFAHGSSHPARPEVRRLAPLFAELSVDLHLSGHDQSFERTHAIDEVGAVAPPESASPVATYARGRGVIYAKVSPAGKRSDRGLGFSGFSRPAPREIASRSDTGHHWARLHIEPGCLEMTTTRMSEPDLQTSEIDRFRIVRNGAD